MTGPVRIEGVSQHEIECADLEPHAVLEMIIEAFHGSQGAFPGPTCVAPLEQGGIEEIVSAFRAIGWNKPRSQYERYLSEEESGRRSVLVAYRADRFAGYVTIDWRSEYEPFHAEGIPEIQDLNVLPEYRNQGIGSAFLDAAESRITSRSPLAGIGVGLHPGYNAAQRLYVVRGYVPDGRGVTSHGKAVAEGARIAFDDELVLWMTKALPSRC